jgi:hypothetical protein
VDPRRGAQVVHAGGAIIARLNQLPGALQQARPGCTRSSHS